MVQGFIRSEPELNKCWSEVEIMDFIEKQVEEKLNQIPKEDEKFRYEKCLFLLIFAHSLRLENYKSSRAEQCLQSTNYKHMPELAK